MFYTIYRITNKINGKFYIGMHKTKVLDDGYMGSGKLIKRAIAKYGVENFLKEILYVFDNEEQMCLKEAELVVIDKTSYNLCPGGKEGFGYINSNRLGGTKGFKWSDKTKALKSAIGKLKWQDPEYRAARKDNYSKGLKPYKEANPQPFLGKVHTEESKRKISESAKATSKGQRNSQFGTMWITNDVDNKKVVKDSEIPQGWRKGRKLIK